jgi:hypothetical protein
MSKLRERLEEGFVKSPSQFNTIVILANNLAKQLTIIPNLPLIDDDLFLINAKKLEKLSKNLIKSMKEKGKVIRA